MKYKWLLSICMAGWGVFVFSDRQDPNAAISVKAANPLDQSGKPAASVIAEKPLKTVKEFVHRNNYNKETCFFINMSLASGTKRFFVYSLNKDSVMDAGLVTHGNCYQYWLEGRKYSNSIGSGCTSLGKYKIGKPYYGKFGLAYKLYGLDETNNNALKRFIVMHSHACVPDEERKEDICQSNGCPTLSPSFLARLEGVIDKSQRPILLYIFE